MFKTKAERSEEYKNEAKRKETLNEHLADATRLGFLDVVKELVRMGAEIRGKEDLPLLNAAFYGRANIAKYFLSEGGVSPITDRDLIDCCIFRATDMFSSLDEKTALVFTNFLLLDTVKTKLKPSLTQSDLWHCFQAVRKCRHKEKYSLCDLRSPYASACIADYIDKGIDYHLDKLIENLGNMIEIKI